MRTSVLLLSSLVFCGCARPGYFANRLNDGADILTLTVGLGVGAKISVMPVYANALCVFNKDEYGLRYGDFVVSPQRSAYPEDNDVEYGVLFMWGMAGHNRTELQKRRNKAPSDTETGFPFLITRHSGGNADPLAIDCVLGLGPSVRFGISPLELVDFVFGWTTLDLAQDDIKTLPDHLREDAEEDMPEPTDTGEPRDVGGED